MPIHIFKPISAKFITSAAMLALIAGFSPAGVQSAYAYDCLLDTNNDGNADSNVDTDGGADSGGSDLRLACGVGASAAGVASTALGYFADAAGPGSTAVGRSASAAGDYSTAVGYAANHGVTSGAHSVALGEYVKSAGTNAIAIGSDSGEGNFTGANAEGDDSIVIGADAGDGGFAGSIVIGKDALATETDQVILKSADTFTILGNGDVGIGTAAPLANLDINSGAADTTLLLNNTSAQWELKSKASTGRLNFKNLTLGGVPFKLGPNSVNGLLSVGTMANDLVEVRGELMVEGNVDVTGTLTTGGPTCGGGCDAVFSADYDLPSIEEHAAQMYANSYLPEIGPTVPHAPMNVSETIGTMLNELEKAHIYIAQLKAERDSDRKRIDRLEAYLVTQSSGD